MSHTPDICMEAQRESTTTCKYYPGGALESGGLKKDNSLKLL